MTSPVADERLAETLSEANANYYAGKPSITDEYEETVDCNSPASPSQAVAAARIDPEPGPAYILPELNSGGNAA